MDIQAIKTFLTVAQEESFSKAARLLHLTQPAISQRIAGLEEELNTSLFHRSGKKLLLTQSGLLLQQKGKLLINQADELAQQLKTQSKTVSGTLHFGTSHHVGLHHLPITLRQYNERYPQVTLDLQFMESEAAYERVLQGELELAIVTISPKKIHSTLTHKALWQDPLVFTTAVDHPLAQQDKLSLTTISNYQGILPEADTFTGRLIHELFNKNHLPLSVALATNYLETIKMLTHAGLGWSVLPKSLIDEHLYILSIPQKLTRTLGVIYHPKRPLSSAAQALLTLIDEQIKKPAKL